MLGTLDIVVRRGKQLGNDAFNIIPDVPGFCQRGCIRNGKRHIQQLCQRPDQVRLAGAGRPYHQHIGFFHFDFVGIFSCNPFVMVIDCYRHDFLGMLLADDIIIQLCLDFVRGRNCMNIKHRSLFFLFRLFLFDFLCMRHHILQV